MAPERNTLLGDTNIVLPRAVKALMAFSRKLRGNEVRRKPMRLLLIRTFHTGSTIKGHGIPSVLLSEL